jgi:hypothetical protein
MALGCFLDMMPPEQRLATEEQLKLAAEICENKGDMRAANFCRALAGVDPPERDRKHLRIVN